MTFMSYIDLYCERTAQGFWNEPLNAISNAAFLIAAWVAWRALRDVKSRGTMDVILICLAACIGIGSFLFHTYANGQTEIMDVIPIWLFVTLYVATVIFRLSNGNGWKTLRIMLIVVGGVGLGLWMTSGDVSTQTADRPGVFNGSLQYLPAFVALWTFYAITLIRRHPAQKLVV